MGELTVQLASEVLRMWTIPASGSANDGFQYVCKPRWRLEGREVWLPALRLLGALMASEDLHVGGKAPRRPSV